MSAIRTGFGIPTGLPYEEAIERAAALGFDAVEIIMHGELDREGMAARSTELRDLLATHGLDLIVHLPMPIDLGSPFEPIRAGNVEAIRACIEVAAATGAEKGVLHPTSAAGGSWDAGAIRDRILDSVAEIDGIGREHGFEICAENLPNKEFTLGNFGQLLSATDASMTLDTGHGRLSGFSADEIAAFAADHRDRISHVHLNDNRADVTDAGDEHLPFGAGTMEFGTILDPLLGGGWAGTMTFEILGYDYEYYRTSKERFEALL